ncbi:MAG: ABC transporter permease [Bryobacterales bacterium]|nr:ABC transporter permease [Bryobacterales bacterium]
MWDRIVTILRKELLQVLREPRLRMMVILPPVMQLIIFGFAVNMDVENARVAWWDQDRSAASRELGAMLANSRYFQVVALPESEEEAQLLLDKGEVLSVVRVGPGFGADIDRGRAGQVQVLMDGTNSNDAGIVSAYVARIVTNVGRARTGATAGGVDVHQRAWFNDELKSRNYFVPGVVMNIITIITLMLTAMAIVREKEIGTMEQLMVTPIRPMELMLGKTIPFALIGLFDMALATGTALVVFHVPFRGTAWMLLGASGLFLLSTLGTGLFLSTISRTQQQAMMSAFFFFTPAFMLSGFTFPIRNMPEGIQWITYLNPLRYFIEVLRGVFLKGTGVEILWPQLAAMGSIGVAILLVSAARFQKRLD